MKLEEIFPRPGVTELSGYEALRKHFAGKVWPAPSLLLNLVTNKYGEFSGATNSSRDISNEADFQSLVGYRQASDLILTTAHTARIEKYHRSKIAPLALVSESGDFSGIPAVESETAGSTESRVYLMVRRGRVRETRKRYGQPWITVMAAGDGGAYGLIKALMEQGWYRIVVEAGPKFANWLLVRRAIGTAAIAVVGYEGQTPEEAVKWAFEALRITGANLESAELVDEETLFTRWTNLQAAPLR